MQLAHFAALCALALLLAAPPASAVSANPIGKVLQLLSDLQAKVVREGAGAQKLYEEYSEWCEDRARELGNEVKAGGAEAESLQAAIASETVSAAALNTKVEELAASIATDEADLKAATEIRAKEAADFAKEEGDLTEVISMLGRALGILEREMATGGTSMLQLRNAGSIVQVMRLMVQASAISSADAAKLAAFLQSSQGEEANDAQEDGDVGAPAASVYKGHSQNILDTLQGLLDKAESQLADSRKKETSDRQNFEMLEQSLEDEVRFANQDLDEAKKGLAASGEAKSTAEGDLTTTSEEVAADKAAKADLHHACMTKAEDFEAETRSRAEELKALAEAKRVIQEATGGAEGLSYGLAQRASLLQLSRATLSSGMDLANFEAVRFVRDLARRQGSPELAQLAQRMGSAMRLASGSSADPFAKVKGLIADMIAKLESEADTDATKKAYCDKELLETGVKRVDKIAEIEKLSTKVDQMAAQSAQLKEQVAELQNALSKLAASQAEMDKLRQNEKTAYVANKADMEQGLEGIKIALNILNEYYASKDKAHAAANGAANGIIGLLEVIESDFSKGLAEVGSTEEAAAAAYEQETKENEIEKATKDKDVEHKAKEAAYLDKTSAELSSDRARVQAELDAVLEYLAKIEEQCIAKAGTYEEQKGRREAEIAGLKQALQILESETALLQQHVLKRRVHRRAGSLRGHLAAW